MSDRDQDSQTSTAPRDLVTRLAPRLSRLFGRWLGDPALVRTALLVILFVTIASRDITRPYYGLHGYGQAITSWFARGHLNYGLGYTHGLRTFAVGNPPPANPARYLDHPLQQSLVDAGAMALFGQNEWALRLAALIGYAVSLPILLQLLRHLFDEATAVLAVLLFIQFPITGYFYPTAGEAHYTNFLLGLLVWWAYLALIGALRDIAPGRRHLWTLGIALFLIVQSDWIGACYGAAVGIHYLLRCLRRRHLPDRRLLSTLLFAPAAGLAVDFGILLGAGGWDFDRLIGLYRFRATAAGTPGRTLTGWLARQGEFIPANFTFPVVVVVLAYIAYLVAVGLRAAAGARDATADPAPERKVTRPFPYAWLFLGPGLVYMALFSEVYWVHQFLYVPFAAGIAIAAALAILQLHDLLASKSAVLGKIAALGILATIVSSSAIGLNRYYASRHYSPDVLEMFRRLNREIPANGALLAYFNYVYQESPFKPPFYRPEVAWYLDREIVTARTLDEIKSRAATQNFSYYLADVSTSPESLLQELRKLYPFEFFKGLEYHPWPPVIAYNPASYLFDLRHPREDVLVPDRGAPSGSSAPPRAAPAVADPMEPALAALYQEGNPRKAAALFRQVLAGNPRHYGATFQLAVALDQAGDPAAARPYWEKALQMAETYRDAETLARARERLARRP